VVSLAAIYRAAVYWTTGAAKYEVALTKVCLLSKRSFDRPLLAFSKQRTQKERSFQVLLQLVIEDNMSLGICAPMTSKLREHPHLHYTVLSVKAP
jgi:hypothetical protein